MSSSLKLRGIIPALVTPFSAAGQVEEDSLKELVEFQIKSNVNGLFPLGTTGLGAVMQPEQRKRVAEVVVKAVKGRVPVIVQVGAVDPLVSLDLASHAEGIGADAVASLTPFYFHPGEEAIIEHYQKLSRATSLPLLVYNIPSNTGNNVDANMLVKLSKIPRVIGIKDSSRDFVQLLDYLEKAPSGFNVINGTDSYLFSAFCAGIVAGVSATASAFPEIFVEMYDAFRNKNYERGKTLQLRIHSLRGALSNPPIAPLLEALKMRGFRSGTVKPPLRTMTTQEVQALRIALGKLVPEIKLIA
jgi:4-hydroxy-tetrahydrodipicolinate synthase